MVIQVIWIVTDFYHFKAEIANVISSFKKQLEPDGTEVELVPGFRVIVSRKTKMHLFHN